MDRKIHILQVMGSLDIGGMETVAMNIVRFSDPERFQFDMLVYGDKEYAHEPEARALGCRVIHVPFPRENPTAFFKNLKKLLREDGTYDIVHSHLLHNSGIVMKAAADVGVPVRIAHCHTNRLKKNPSRIRRVYERLMLGVIKKYATHYYACSVRAGEYLHGRDFTKVGHVMSNGVNLQDFSYDPEEVARYKKELGVQDCKLIGQVGNLKPVKNHQFSLEVFAKLRRQRQDVKLLIIGGGPLEEEVRQQIRSLSLEDAVIMLGKRTDVLSLLNVIDVYLMPSIHEGVSVALMEAQTAGLPCVVSDTACAPEVRVTDQITALRLDADKALWVEALQNALEQPRYTDSHQAVRQHGYHVPDIIAGLDEEYIRYVEATGRC